MSMNPLRLISRRHDAELEATLAEAVEQEAPRFPPPLPMIDSAQASVSKFLDRARAKRDQLETEIASKQEDLRQTRVAIEAFEASEKVLEAGRRDDEPLTPADDMAERRVPRHVRGSIAEMAAAEEIRDANGKVVKSRDGEVGQVEAAE